MRAYRHMQCICIRVDGELLAGLAGEPTQRAIPAFRMRLCGAFASTCTYLLIHTYIYIPIRTYTNTHVHKRTFIYRRRGAQARPIRVCMHAHIDIAYMIGSRSDTHAYAHAVWRLQAAAVSEAYLRAVGESGEVWVWISTVMPVRSRAHPSMSPNRVPRSDVRKPKGKSIIVQRSFNEIAERLTI